MKSSKTIIVGGGPTGLGAAVRFSDLKKKDWLLLEASKDVGGLASTFCTNEGFLFDIGGHVIFSHYQYFDDCLNAALPDKSDWYHHQRISYVRSFDRWVAYPYQNNICQLPEDQKLKCLDGLIEAFGNFDKSSKPKSFEEWILRTLGKGIADVFMRDYNFKVWAIYPSEMSASWLGERVAAPNLKLIMRSIIKNEPCESWGPNATFRFPSRGGTEHIWKSVASKLIEPNLLKVDAKVTEIDIDNKKVSVMEGNSSSSYYYDQLINTMPLDKLIECLRSNSNPNLISELRDLSSDLFFSSSHIIGIGIRGKRPEATIGNKCWLYFPEDNCPFYRATVFSNYAENNCPPPESELPTLKYADGSLPSSDVKKAGPYWSLMFEVSESIHKPVDKLKIVADTIKGAINTGLIEAKDEIVSIFYERFNHGYPTPTLKRDSALNIILPILEKHSIYSRGRFGAWKYEVGNQDHSFMQGVECADRILFGAPELTLNEPNWVNGRRNNERTFTLENLCK